MKKCCASIDAISHTEISKIIDTFDFVLKMSVIGRNEGLLSVEVYANTLNGDKSTMFLKEMLEIICDGIDPGKLEEIGYAAYCSKAEKGLMSLEFLLIIRGVLLAQEGNHPMHVRKLLYAMLPEAITDVIDNRDEPEEMLGENC